MQKKLLFWKKEKVFSTVVKNQPKTAQYKPRTSTIFLSSGLQNWFTKHEMYVQRR